MLIAEELLLIALDPDTGRIPLGTRDFLRVGLAGSLLAELAFEGHLELANGQVRRAGTSMEPPSDALLLGVLAGLPVDRFVKPKAAVKGAQRVPGGLWEQLVDRLIDAGVLGRARGSALTPTRHPVLDRSAHSAVLAAARDAANSNRALEPREAVVLAFVGPCRLLERVAPRRQDRRHAKDRISEATKLSPFGPAVKAIIDEIVAAAGAVAATTAVVAST